MAVQPEARLKEMGIELPAAPKPVGSYLPVVRTGNLLFVSGQLPMEAGRLAVAGKVGREVTLEQAVRGAELAVLNGLAQVAAAIGGLDKVSRVIRIGVFVNSGTGFTDQAKVANGASDLLVNIFGEQGRHARAAVGASELPLNAAVEVELVVEIRSSALVN